MATRTDLKIPYGVSDFKTIRNEGLYHVDKTRFLANVEKLFGGLWLRLLYQFKGTVLIRAEEIAVER